MGQAANGNDNRRFAKLEDIERALYQRNAPRKHPISRNRTLNYDIRRYVMQRPKSA